MNARIYLAVLIISLSSSIALAQMGNYGGGMQQQSQPPSSSNSGQSQGKMTTTTKSKTTYPQGVKGYLDQQLGMSKDKKFHVSLNGKDLALTPVKIPQEGKSSGKAMVPVEMKGADGKTYEIDFTTSNGQVTGAQVGKVNGQKP